MTDSDANPYSPPATSSVHVAAKMSQPVRAILTVLSFGLITFLTWFALLLVFFANSTAFWPGYACVVPAVAIGLYACRTPFLQKLVSSNQICNVVAILSVCLLLAMITLARVAHETVHGATYPVTPSPPIGLAPFHWMLFGTSLVGFLSGLASSISISHRGITPILLAVSVSCFACLVYLVLWLIDVVQLVQSAT